MRTVFKYCFPPLLIALTCFSSSPQLNAQQTILTPTQQALLKEADRLSGDVIKLIDQRKYEQGIAPSKRALEIRRSILGDEHPDTATALTNRGDLHFYLGEYAAARPYYEQALKIRKKFFGGEDRDTAASLNDLGVLLSTQGDRPAARQYYEQALKIRKKVLGDEHPDTATSLNDLGSLLSAQSDYAAARPYIEEALRIRKKVLGNEHSDTAISLTALGLLLHYEGDYIAARPYYEQALQVYKKILGDEHPYTATSLNNLAELLRDQGDYVAARRYHEQALKIRKKVLGDEHPELAVTLNNFGLLLQSQGDFAAARPSYEQAFKIYKKVLGEEHPDTAMTLNNLGSLLQAQGDYAAARSYFEQALRIRKKVLREHPDTAMSLNNLGLLFFAQSDYVAARPYYEQTLQIYKKVLGDEHPDTATSLNNLGELLRIQGDYAAARPYLEQALKIRKKVLGDEHPVTANSYNNMGFLLQSQRDYVAARQYYERGLQVNKKVLGDAHPDTALSLNNLLILEMAMGNRLAAMALMDQSRRGASRHIAQVLPGLSDQEQLYFLEKNDENSFHLALSLGLLSSEDRTIARVSAGWLLNGKGVAQVAVAQRNLLTRDVKNPALAGTIQKLIDVRRQLANQVLSIPKSGQEQIRREAIDQLTAQEATLTREVAQKTARPELAADPWVDLDAVRNAIPEDGMLVEIAQFKVFDVQAQANQSNWKPARYVAWLIPPAGKGEVEIIDLGAAVEIDDAVAKANKTMSEASNPNGPLVKLGAVEAEKIALSDLARVRDLVWTPLAAKIPAGTKHLILSPDGNLWLLPWAALPLGQDKLLLDNFVLNFEISGRDLARPRAKLGEPGPPAVFADPDYDLPPAVTRQSIQAIFPKLDLNDEGTRGALSQTAFSKVLRLPNTALEAEAVSPNMRQITGADPQKYVGQYALESVVKRVERPKMLMLSTHGFFLPDQQVKRDERLQTVMSSEKRSTALLTVDGKPVENPLLRCGLLFAGCNSQQSVGGDEGVLTGMEVVSLDLRGTELVVLSACETGVGKVRNGQGVAGLRQAFQLAGAETVVATLWQVPDRDSAIIMNDFFQNMADGQSKAVALRNAQLKRIQSRRDRYGAAHPHYWAAWTITGR